MAYAFKRAVRENVGLLIGLAGASGSGKTYTAMRLAAGICGDKPFAVIDTESGRALHYADAFKFDHCELHAPFRPSTYLDAIVAADKAGYPVIVVDSASHEHAGDGGLLDWHEELLNGYVERAANNGDSRGEWQIREANNMRGWIEPKMAHKKMVQRLLQCRAHVILCFRAEEKIEIGKDEKGKTKIVPKKSIVGLNGWMPVCEKNLPYELTCSFLLTADKPGIPQPIKLQEQHKVFFPLDRPIAEESGKLIAQWASGGKLEKSPKSPVEQKTGKSDTPEKEAVEKVSPHATGGADGGKSEPISEYELPKIKIPADWGTKYRKSLALDGKTWEQLTGKELDAIMRTNDNERLRKGAYCEIEFRKQLDEPLFPADWPERRKAEKGKGCSVPYKDCGAKVLENLRKDGDMNAVYEMRFKIDQKGEPIPSDEKLFATLHELMSKK